MNTVWEHDESLGHEFYALTSMTDKCELCGCMVNDCRNWDGEKGSRFDEPCKFKKTDQPQDINK
jgi:hypothetical protein